MADFNFVVDVDITKFMSGKNPLNIERAIAQGIKNGLRDCSKQIRSKLRDNLSKYGLSSLQSQIKINEHKDGIIVTISEGGQYYAMYVEYGTGIVGAASPHPDPSRHGWEYDINDHGDEGWWYPTDGDDPNPTKYLGKQGGWWAWTAGQASRPFMYDTWLWARRSFSNIITKHIASEVDKELGNM